MFHHNKLMVKLLYVLNSIFHLSHCRFNYNTEMQVLYESFILWYSSFPSKIRFGGPNLRFLLGPMRSRLAFILPSRFNEWSDHIYPFFRRYYRGLTLDRNFEQQICTRMKDMFSNRTDVNKMSFSDHFTFKIAGFSILHLTRIFRIILFLIIFAD